MLDRDYTPGSKFEIADDPDDSEGTDSSRALYTDTIENPPAKNSEQSGPKITVNKDGSAVERDNSGRITSLEYPDKSKIVFRRDKRGEISSITDTDASSWTRSENGKTWINDKSGKERLDMRVSYEGILSFKDQNQASHSIDRSGLHKCVNPDRSVLEARAGLIISLKRPDGSRIECSYEDGILSHIKVNNKESYFKTSDQWIHKKDGKEYRSEKPEISPDGTCNFHRGDIAAREEISLRGDGSITYANGARTEFGKDGKTTLVERPNGSKTEFQYRSGQLHSIKETYIDKKTAQWSKEQGKWWSMDQLGRSYQSITVSHDGIIDFDTGDKYKGTRYVDGTQRSSSKDGASWIFDERKRIVSYTRPDGSKLLYEHSNPGAAPTDKGKLLRVKEVDKAREETWEAGENDEWTSNDSPAEKRSKIRISEKGECAYIALRDGEVTSIKYPSGASRSFERTEDGINKISAEDSKGGKIVWQRSEDKQNWTDGKSQEWRDNVKVSHSGELSFHTENGEKLTYSKDDRELKESVQKQETSSKTQESAERLTALVSAYFKDPKELEFFKADLEKFKSSLTVRGVSDDAARKSLDELSEMLLSEHSEAPFDKSERAELVKQTLRHIAHPREIDQGWHNTCNVATIQILTATQNPENFASLLKEVSTTGKFTSKENLEIKIDRESLKADFEAKEYNPYKPQQNDGIRSLASQVFQVTAINSFYVATKSPLRYFQKAPENARDNGERLMNPASRSVAAKQPRLTADNMVEIGKQVNGKTPVIIASSAVGNKKTTNVSSETELKTKIQDLQNKNQLPVIVEVFTDHEPYRQESGPGGCHVVTLWGMDKSGKILMDNQWGKSADHEGLSRLSTAQVFKALHP